MELPRNINSQYQVVAQKRLDFSSVTPYIYGTDNRQNSDRRTNVIYCLYKTVCHNTFHSVLLLLGLNALYVTSEICFQCLHNNKAFDVTL